MQFSSLCIKSISKTENNHEKEQVLAFNTPANKEKSMTVLVESQDEDRMLTLMIPSRV